MTQQIKSLESELGAQLFIREKNKLYPTAAAHYLYKESRRILRLYDTLMSDMRNFSDTNKRILRIGINYYSLYEWLKVYTGQFEELYDNISIVFEFYPSNGLLTNLDKGSLDVVLLWDQYATNLGLYTCNAFTSKGVILVPKGNPLYHAELNSYYELMNQRIVVLVEELPYFKSTGHLDKLLNAIYQNSSLQKEDIIISDNINQALLLSSEENLCILTFEDKLYKITQHNLRTVIMKDSFMNNQFVFAWKQEEDNAVRKLFIKYIKQLDFDS